MANGETDVSQDTEPDRDDSTDRSYEAGLGGGPCGSPGVPAGLIDFPMGEFTSTADQPEATAPAGSSTDAQPRPEDFM
jgi:hypothetical protein